ncbi:hypothetical protein PISL3812_09928 [Talaromyces islandicus]|uniref:Uncharacterized protein n=1 Tax=Talaromyces islandicus TaxID=28573 RepID=A0A0U1MBB8_TALIS|nr:hypothetical protein PISL3812_09928 [Talaromyces islandicus]
MEIATSDAYTGWACNYLKGLTDEDINRHGPVLDTMLDRIGPLRGWEKKSRMVTAEELLDKMLSSIGSTRKFLDRAMTELILDHIRETRPAGDPRLAYSSPGRNASPMGLLLHGFCIRAHTMACGGLDVDRLARVSNPEECFKGNIPSYSKKCQLDQKTMERCIGRYFRVQFLSDAVNEEGICMVAAPVLPDFSRISYAELRRAGHLLLTGNRYSLLLETARQLSPRRDKCQETFNYAMRESFETCYDLD